jgi:hypothetical protein
MSPSKDDALPTKIAIKGFSLSSKSSAPKPKPNSTTTLGKRPRTKFAAHDSDSEDESRHHTKAEVVTGFSANGAIRHTERKVEGPLVIPKLKNKDWKSEARQRGGKNLLPPEVQAAQEAARRERERGANGEGKTEGVDVVNSGDGEIQWGLSVRKRVQEDVSDADPVPGENNGYSTENGGQDQEQKDKKPKTADEEALASLLGQDTKPKGPDLIIPTSALPPISRMTEDEAYRKAVQEAPDVSTLEDYERVPVEEFGAALLRGMGWDGVMRERGEGRRDDKKGRRQNLLGLGAKELKGAEELGAWVNKSDVKRLKPAGESKGRERPKKIGEYQREKEEKRGRREGGYMDERDRERERERDRGGRDRYERDRYDRDRRR